MTAMEWSSGALQRTVEAWGRSSCLLGAGVVIAYVVEKVIHRRLKRWSEHSTWPGAPVVTAAARGVILLWLIMGSVVIASDNAPITPDNKSIIEHVIKVLWVLSGTMVAARSISGSLRIHLSHLPGIGATSIITNVSTILIYLVGFLVAFQSLGYQLTAIFTFLGIGGLAVALALQDTLSNLFAGIHIIISRHVRAGDYVRIDADNEGFVSDIGWRNTTFRSLSNNLVVVPNAKLAGSIVINYTLPEKLLVIKVTLGVAYESDLAKVEAVTLEVARAVLPEASRLAKMEPSVHYHTFADSSILLDVSLPVPDVQEQNRIKHDFIMQLHERFRREGIDIPSPIRTVRLSPPERAALTSPSPPSPGAMPPGNQ